MVTVIVAVALVKDEADIIGYTVQHLVNEGVDRFLIADNGSTDDTRAILDKFTQVTVIDDEEPGHYQSRKTTALARRALRDGAEWVLPFDADELFYSQHGRIADVLNAVPTVDVVKAWGWDHIPQRRSDSDNPWEAFPLRRDETQKLPKVVFRAGDVRVHEGNHDVDRAGFRADWVLSYRHLAFRSFEQMARKLRNGKTAIEATDLDPMFASHWREGGAKTTEELRADWDARVTEDGVYDPAPYRA